MAAHQREQAAILGPDRIDLAPAGQEVMVDEADDMEAIGHDLRVGKVLADQRAIDARQIHADDPHAIFARQLRQVALQRGFAAAQHHVEDLVRRRSQKVVA